MASNTTRYRKVTISLLKDLIAYADSRAKRIAASRSGVIAQALTALMQAEEKALAIEGYRFYAAEAEAFAAAAGPVAAEVILADQPW
jgi:metal-responsive CopG/Arc/MetJ family transcriptional regulator